MEGLIQCISAFIACLGFAFVFRIHHHIKFAIIGSIGGALSWLIYLLASPINNDFIINLIAMVTVALYSEIMARIYKAPATVFLLIGCFPLVPGKGIYETMLYCVQGNSDMFVNSFIHTLSISGAIALAILLVSTLFKIIKKLKLKQVYER